MVLTLLTVALGPVLLISGAAILGVPLASMLTPQAPTIMMENLPRLDAGLRDVERVVGLGATAVGLLLSVASLIAVLATALLVAFSRLGRGEGGRARALLERLSPGFMRRSLVVALTAQLAVGGAAVATHLHHQPADQTPVASAPQETGGPESGPIHDDARGSSDGQTPLDETRSAASDRQNAPGDSGDPGSGGDLMDDRPDAHTTEQETTQEEDVVSPLFTPDAPGPENDRHQGGETRERAAPEVTVRAGDTLWSITADHLGPQATEWEIAEAWPQWHEANREIIGEDPHSLLPGAVLTPPDDDGPA